MQFVAETPAVTLVAVLMVGVVEALAEVQAIHCYCYTIYGSYYDIGNGRILYARSKACRC